MAFTCLVAVATGCGGEDRARRIDGIAGHEPRTVEFGRVGLGTTAVRSLTVRNDGRAPLRIVGWDLPGTGKDFSISLQGRRMLFEGDSAVLTLRYTPEAEERLERTLSVQTDDPARQTMEIPVRGEAVLPFVVPDPPALDFGRVELDVKETLPVTLRNEFDIEVSVRIGIRGDSQFAADPAAFIQVPALGTAVVDVSFQPNLVGRVEGELSLLPCPSCDEILVSLVGTGIDQALVVMPPEVDFGFVPVERSAERSFTVTNVSSRQVEVLSMTLAGTSQNFSLAPWTGTLLPGQAVQVVVGFSPTMVDPEEQEVEIASTSARAPALRVRLLGAGGGPQIQVSPEALAFGAVPVGSRGQIPLIITNAGTTPGAPPLEILDIRVENPAVAPFGPDRDLAADPVTLDAGEQDRVLIGYEPAQATGGVLETAELVILSNDASQPEIRLPMSGSGFDVPPCTNLELTPARLDFGALDQQKGATLTFKIYNPGPEMCIMRNLRIAPGSDPVFKTREVQSFLIPGDQWFGWMVSFDPAAEGAGEGQYQGELELFAVNATQQQRYTVGLRASSDDGCLVPDPNFLDFGSERSGCGVRDGQVRFTNVCPLPLMVGPISLGTETPNPGDFEILGAPATPFFLPSGGTFAVDVRWNSLVRGMTSAALFVGDETRARPLMVPLLGEVLKDGSTTDRFMQLRSDAVDVLFVVDNSSSMVEEQPRLRDASHVLIDEAVRTGIDFHLGVTTTGLVPGASAPACPGGADGGEAGRLFPVDGSRPRIVSSATPDARGVFAANTQVGFCQELEQGMEAMRLALTDPVRSGSNAGFLRSDTKLAVVFVADEDDHSGFPPEEYASFLLSLKGEGGAIAHAIVDTGEGCPEGAGRGDRLIELALSTGGVVESICRRDWTAAIQEIARRSFSMRTSFSLSGIPDDAGLTVRVDGRIADPSTYRYEPSSNSVTFSPGNEPRPGAVIDVEYTRRCGSP